MKKNLINIRFLIILFLILFPNFVLADGCIIISGGAGGGGGYDYGTLPSECSSCTCNNTCLWSFNREKNPVQGVRFQIYKYDGSGTPTLVGKGVDVWATNALYKPESKDLYHYSSPSTADLNNKSKCKGEDAKQNIQPGQDYFGTMYSLSVDEYFSGENGKVLVDDRFETAGEISENVLNDDYDFGWISDYVLVALIPAEGETEPSKEAIDTFKNYFSFTDQEYNDFVANLDDYYISAEMLYRFYISGSIDDEYLGYGAQKYHLYYGTASESAYFHGDDEVYRALWNNFGTVGKIASRNPNSILWDRTDENREIHPKLSIGKTNTTEYNMTSHGEDNVNNEAACNSMYGYAIWSFSACEKCKPKKTTCSSTCSEYEVGTAEHTTCAENYCKNIPEGAQEEGQTVAACMNTCDTCKDVCKNNADKKTCAETWCSAYDPTNSECVNTCVEKSTCEEDCKGKTGTDLRTCAEEWCSKNASGDETCVDTCAPNTGNKKTCSQECSGKTGTDLKNCAENWCGKNASGDASCVSNCAPPERIHWDTYVGEGCKPEFKTCTGYTDGMSSYMTKKDFVCSSTLHENVDYFLSSLVCTDGKAKNSDLTDIYYTIECQEDVNLVGLPDDNLYVHISESGSSSIYLGYDLNYDKQCNLRYKKAPSSTTTEVVTPNDEGVSKLQDPFMGSSPTSSNWVDEYGNGATMIEYDLARVEKLIDEITARKDDIYSLGIDDSMASRPSSGSSLNDIIKGINTKEDSNVRNKYRGYLDAPDNLTGFALTCDDWLTTSCNYNTTCYNSECPNCFFPPCSCSCTRTKYIYKYQTCSASIAVADGSKYSNCINAENDVKSLLGYYLVALEKLDAMKEELSGMKEKAEQALVAETEKYYKENSGTVTGTSLINQVEISLVDSYGEDNSKMTITLEPISCVTAKEKEERYCETINGDRKFQISESNKTIMCGDEEVKSTKLSDSSRSYHVEIIYGLPSSFLRTLSEKSREVYHSLSDCEKALIEDGDKAGSCIEKEHVWVFDPVDKTVSITAFIEKVKSKKFSVEMSGFGECAQFKATLDCEYQFSDYSECAPECNGVEECLKEKCGCDSYCGSNETCRFMYCPEDCEECGDGSILDCKDECFDKCDPKDVKCLSDECCSKQCNGEEECLRTCCISECAQLYGSSGDEYEACRKGCPDPSDNPGGGPGINYVFRPIDMDNPFPDRKPGNNWSGKVEYITRSNDPNGIYYDATDGRTDDYEYQITIKAKGIREIKNKYSTGTDLTYKDFERMESGNNSVYCSKVIHSDLKNDLSEYVTVDGECLKVVNGKRATS